MLAKYNVDKALGAFEANRPLTTKDMLSQLMQRQHCMWQHMNKQLQLIADSHHQLLPQLLLEDKVTEEQEVAELQAALQQEQHQRQVAGSQAATDPAQPAAAQAGTAVPKAAEVRGQQPGNGSAADPQEPGSSAGTAATSAAAGRAAVTAAGDAVAGAPSSDTAAAASSATDDDNEVREFMTVEQPPEEPEPAEEQKLYTPGGKVRTLSEFRARGVLSPGGRHRYAWFTGQAASSSEHQQKQLDLQPWRQQPQEPPQVRPNQQGMMQQPQLGVMRQQIAQLVSGLVQQELAKQQLVQQQQQQRMQKEQQQQVQGQQQTQQQTQPLLVVTQQQLAQVVGDAFRNQVLYQQQQ